LPVGKVAGPVILGPALYFAYLLIGSLFTDGWLSVRSPTILFFILPSLVFALAWAVVTNHRLQQAGSRVKGWLMLAVGTGAGGLLGLWFDSEGWPIRASLVDRVLVGCVGGFAVIAFFVLPVHVQAVTRARRWLSSPITWREGFAPALMIVIGAFLFFRTTRTGETGGSVLTNGTPPGGWPLFFFVSVMVIVWTQWIANMQAAVNELTIGGETYVPPDEKAVVPGRKPPVPAPAGGGT
jgi:hypothetical protein